MQLPSVRDLSLARKSVLLRTDLDVPLKNGQVADPTRIEKSLPTIKYLLDQKAKVTIIAHLDRPGGKVVPELSLKPVVDFLNELLPGVQDYQLHENLRFEKGEEANDLGFAKKLINKADFYVNDAFAVSHRKHASIVSLPKLLPSAFGINFLHEVEVLGKVKQSPKRPVVVILGGAKEDKLDEVKRLLDWADLILIGGKLPQILQMKNKQISKSMTNDKCRILVANLNKEGKDIDMGSIGRFEEVIMKAGTVVWAGPMGVWEEEQFEKGTREIAQAIIESKAFSIIGGGDTEAALTELGLEKKINFISSGGGAMFEFLATGTLAGIEAIRNFQCSNVQNSK